MLVLVWLLFWNSKKVLLPLIISLKKVSSPPPPPPPPPINDDRRTGETLKTGQSQRYNGDMSLPTLFTGSVHCLVDFFFLERGGGGGVPCGKMYFEFYYHFGLQLRNLVVKYGEQKRKVKQLAIILKFSIKCPSKKEQVYISVQKVDF